MIKLSRLNYKRFTSVVRRGFSLIELLVVIAIFIVITSVVLARQNRFSSDILLTDLAYQVAISIRQAQVYGLGVQAQLNNNFDIGYGIHFQSGAQISTYQLFADNNKNGILDSGGSSDSSGGSGSDSLGGGGISIGGGGGKNNGAGDSIGGSGGIPDLILNTYQVQKGDRIFNVCGIRDDTRYCFSDENGGKGSNLSSMDVVYIRPNPEALIHSDGTTDTNHTYTQATITIVSSVGSRYKCIKVDQTGQVSVYNPTDPNNPSICS